jgi:hypothetical protein
MRHQKIWLMVLSAVLLLTSPALALEVGIRGSYWFPGLNGDLTVDGDSLSGTKLDLSSDLDMEAESAPMIEAFAGIGNHHLSLTYYRFDYEGDTVLKEQIAFNGQVYSVGERVSSELSYTDIDVAYRYDLIDLENFLAGGSLGPVGKVKFLDGSARLETSTVSEDQDFSAPIPMLGAHLHVGVLMDILEFRAQLAGMGYGGASIFEGFADLSYTPFPFLDIHGGYRILNLHAETDDVELNFNTTGPYVALTVGF